MKMPRDFNFIVPPIGEYQEESVLYGCINDNAGLLLDLGLGKTFCAINIARYRIQDSEVKKVLVVCPSTIIQSWIKSIHKFSEYEAVSLYSKSRPKRLKQFKKRAEFYITNYEGLHPFREEFYKLKPDMVIFDESARYVKGANTQRTNMSIVLADIAKYVLILTGTIISNKPLYLWSQIRLLDGGLAFSDNFWRFRSKYFTGKKKKSKKGKYYKKYTLSKKNVDYFADVIYDNCIRFKREDVIDDLPETIFDVVNIPLDGELDTLYNNVADEIIKEIETASSSATININSIFTKLIRLQQITSGFIKDEDGEIKELKTQPKLKSLLETIESIEFEEESAVVWCKFRYSIDMIERELKRLGIKCITMDGRQDTPAKKYERWRTFQEDKSITVFIGQAVSGGIGIELFKENSTKTQHMLFYENSDLDTRLQCCGRIDRHGQQSKLLMYKDYIIEDTYDMRVLQNIEKDKNIADDIMENGLRNVLTNK